MSGLTNASSNQLGKSISPTASSNENAVIWQANCEFIVRKKLKPELLRMILLETKKCSMNVLKKGKELYAY